MTSFRSSKLSSNHGRTPRSWQRRWRLAAALLGIGLLGAGTHSMAPPVWGATLAHAAAKTPVARIPGLWLPPISAAPVISAFDPPPQRWLAGHRGVDLRAPTGTAVTAAGAGRVRFAGDVAGRGVVVLDHGDLVTTYEPVAAQVAVGDAVAAGAPIGVIGSGGHCSDRCLHWGAKRGEEYLDPLWLLRGYTPVLKVPW